MKGKVSLFFLAVFAGVQIYFGRHPMTHQVLGSSWIEVSRQAGTVVNRQQRYYLVSKRNVYQIHANSVHVSVKRVSVSWEEVPQPGGQGIWKVAYTSQSIPIMGQGGTIFPSSDGRQVIWKDPLTGGLYQSQTEGGGLKPFAPRLRHIDRVLWAPDGAAVAVLASGPEGYGIYVFDGDKNAISLIPSARLLDFGFTREETVVAALARGRVLWQGHAELRLPAMHPAYVDNGVAAIWGVGRSHTVLWEDGRIRTRPRPAVHFFGPAKFSEGGSDVAILAKDAKGQGELYLDGPVHQWSLRLPYDIPVRDYRLEGFLGNRWALVAITKGKHRGTYAWWVNAL